MEKGEGKGQEVQVLPVAFFMSNATLIGSLWMVVALTLDRYFAFCHPYWHRKVAHKTTIRRVLGSLSVFIVAYSFPHYFDFKVRPLSFPPWHGPQIPIPQLP